METIHRGQAACPQCGAGAQWSDQTEGRIEIRCPNCGTFSMTRTSFDEVAAGFAPEEDL